MNAYNIVNTFEETIAEYAGSKYAIAVESCTAALFLSCIYKKVKWVHIPKFTYPGVPCSIIHAGGRVCFSDEKWSGIYQLRPYAIYDSALRFRWDMYIKGSLYCLSFHIKKHLPIGRGGMILTDDKEAYEWLKRARFDGRREKPLLQDNLDMLGWNFYLSPEQAARGLQLFEFVSKNDPEDLPVDRQGYPDLSNFPIYKGKYEEKIKD